MSPSIMKPSTNPKPLQTVFARRFLRALTAINLSRRSSTISARARRIKQAADISLASAAMACNANKAWSRAVHERSRAVLERSRAFMQRQRRLQRKAAVTKKESRGSRASMLRRLVPGGEGMDFCGLLDEAADYIKSLKAQVQVMQCIADSFSP